MKMNLSAKITYVILFTIISLNLNAQYRTITGIIKDVQTKEPLPFCSIALRNSFIGTNTDIEGKFKINIPPSKAKPQLIVSYLGYKTDTINIAPSINNYSIFMTQTQSVMNEVVITGVSKATLIKENPVHIISISAKEIEQTNESNIIDAIVKNAPGLNAVKTGPNISKPFIRGLGYNRVLTLYDGVRQEGQQWGDEHGIEVDAYNIEKAEVINGPASLMYGSDALAGVVSLMPSKPQISDVKESGRFFSEFQSNNGLFGNGLRISLGSKHWSYALAVSYRIAKNYSNTIDGRVYNTGFQETNASGTILHATQNGYSSFNLTLYDNLQGIPDGSRDSLTRKFTKQIYEGTDDQIKNRPIVTNAELNSYQLSPLHQHIQHYRIYSNNHYNIGKGDVDFLFAFQQNIRREYNHPTDPQQAGMFVRLNTLSYGFRYNAPSILNTEISVGINGMYQNNLNKNATDFPIPDYNLFDFGSYIYAKWKYKKWTISGGVRYDIRYLQGNNFYTRKDTITGFERQVKLPDTAGAYLQFPSFKKTFNGLSFSIGSTYQITNQISIKANVARGYRAPSITEFASNGLDPGAHIIYLGNRNFVPEFSLQEEVGISGNFEGVSASVSMFNNNIQDYIYLTQLTNAQGNPIINTQGNKTYQYQQASAQLYGMEASLDLHPKFIKGFSFNNSFSMVYGFNRKAEYKDKGVNGEYLPFIPPPKLLSSVNQNLKTKSTYFPAFNFRIETDYNASQNRYLALNKTESYTPSYILVNIAASAEIKYSKKSTLQFQVQVNNLLNTNYQSNLSRLKYFEYYIQSPNGHLGIYGMGRNIGVKLILPF
ncbi:MAG: TonB-dependent receptor [Bacteroidales bacterium]|jgi:iron complex outermembrane receptor protein